MMWLAVNITRHSIQYSIVQYSTVQYSVTQIYDTFIGRSFSIWDWWNRNPNYFEAFFGQEVALAF